MIRIPFSASIASIARLGALALMLAAAASAQDATTKWMRLWNGKDLAGWRLQEKYWKVDSGMIVGKGRVDGNYNTFAIPPGTYSDFELSVRARLYERNIAHYTNSGIQYRSAISDTARKILRGPQLDIGDGASASMYPEGGLGGSGAGSSAACRSAMRMDEFNHYLIAANGSRSAHKLNGAECNDFATNVSSGVIGLQLHFITNAPAPAGMEVNFKDIYIRPLNNSFAIPDSLAVYLKSDYTATGSVGVSGAAAWRERSLRPLARGWSLSIAGLPEGARIQAFDPLGRERAVRAIAGGGAGRLRFELAEGGGGMGILRVAPE